MAFSKMFFLHPEGGKAYRSYLGIKDVAVMGNPDIRYMMPRKEEIGEKLFIVTEIIFTFLTVTNDQFDDILIGVGNKTQTSSIIYTRPYDYMDEADRNELMEPLFWLGYIQSVGYSIYGSAQVSFIDVISDN
ncbi:hypothetical protein FSP39_024166 [Pinctada imbricata]|uniref:Uncharacterized protein n=1 Tax=Pinctada imbricata TaxID=66713 RepID=A0AA88YKM0_PINIB|nr:hypothetical protein FSP39_024166 [Pinctada imbricata]